MTSFFPEIELISNWLFLTSTNNIQFDVIPTLKLGLIYELAKSIIVE